MRSNVAAMHVRSALLTVAFSVCTWVYGQSPMLDPFFDAGIGSDGAIFVAAVQSDGRIVVGGHFTSFQGEPYVGVARLHPDGTLDNSFWQVPFWVTAHITSLVVDPQDRILVAGYFSLSIGETDYNYVVRLMPDGSVDPDFVLGTGPDAEVYDMILLDDGDIMIVGDFTDVSGAALNGIARLQSNGAIDPSFDPGEGFSAVFVESPQPYSLAVDQEGRFLVGGWFDTYDGTWTGPLVRLTPDGQLDPGFEPPSFEPEGSEINDILLLDDGRIRVVGWILAFGAEAYTVVGLLQDGAPDPQYIQEAVVDGAYQLVKDGELMLIAGLFEEYQGISRRGLARVDANGALDPGFDLEEGFDGYFEVVRQEDGALLVVGDFTEYNGTPRVDIARLLTSVGLMDCLGVVDGPSMPGTSCDDQDPNTVNDVWTSDCECQGSTPAMDCLGVAGGTAMPGTPCDDGIFFTSNDTWTTACLCQGFDCAGLQGGSSLPGTPCDDGVAWTYNDTWGVGCVCQGVGLVGVGEQENSSGGLELWPNPSAAEDVWVQVPLPSGTMAQIDIHDALGRRCWSQATVVHGTSPVQLRTSGFAPGVYLVNILSTQGSFTGRLVVR